MCMCVCMSVCMYGMYVIKGMMNGGGEGQIRHPKKSTNVKSRRMCCVLKLKILCIDNIQDG
jgi:hypothetical protein